MPVFAWLAVPLAYIVGGLSPGHWLVRRRLGVDVRTHGSGATGATNAGRLLGGRGFAMVLALDAAKGAAVAWGGRLAGLDGGWEFSAAAAVVAGHVWPPLLGLRGGRGLAPMLGAWLVLAPLAALASTAIAGAGWASSGKRAASGVFAAFSLPVVTWWETRSLVAAGWTAAASAIVAFAHRPRARRG